MRLPSEVKPWPRAAVKEPFLHKKLGRWAIFTGEKRQFFFQCDGKSTRSFSFVETKRSNAARVEPLVTGTEASTLPIEPSEISCSLDVSNGQLVFWC